ncbi:MAG: DUF420 domain-containing protein [Holophagales bacterium]|nr:DUF420 domain-containing protein [Holophagales bacterium]
MSTAPADSPSLGPSPGGRRPEPMPVIFGLSAAIAAFLVWWIYFKTTATSEAAWIRLLPATNATFNTLAALCLSLGFLAIRRKKRKAHIRFMLSAVVFSALFLVSYLVYHHYHGDTPFPGQGWIRPTYFAILISHIVLSVVMLPMILSTLFFAGTGRFAKHRRIARWTLPIWLYVSVTGVAIFFLLSAYTG